MEMNGSQKYWPRILEYWEKLIPTIYLSIICNDNEYNYDLLININKK